MLLKKQEKTSKGGQRFGTRHRNDPVSLDSNLDHGERIVAKLTSEIGAETTAELLQSLANKANGSQPSGEQGVVDVDSDDDDAEDEPFERQTPAAVRRHPQGKYLDYAEIDGRHLFDGQRHQIGGINAGLMLLETSSKDFRRMEVQLAT